MESEHFLGDPLCMDRYYDLFFGLVSASFSRPAEFADDMICVNDNSMKTVSLQNNVYG